MAFELELPAFYVDDILLDAGTIARPLLTNREPDPGETGVPKGTNIALELTDVGTDGIDESATQVFVNGVLAFNGGVFQTGFTGPGSNSTAPDADTRRVVIDPTADFTSLQVVTVRVVSAVVGGASSIDESYSFTIEDLTRPIVAAAQSRDRQVVRVTFDEPIQQVDATATNDALNPANYTITRIGTPAVDLVAQTVAVATDSSVDLTTDIEQSPDKQYRVRVVNVEDVAGNPVIAPDDDALFNGFRPVRPARRKFDLFQLMPEINRREDLTQDLERFLAVLQDPTDLLLADIDGFTEILDPDLAPERFLDLMLCDLGNPFEFDLSERDKRRLLRILVDIYREKGTEQGIINAVRFFLRIEIRIVEFVDDEGLTLGESELGDDWVLGPSSSFNRFAFDVISDQVLTDEERKRIRFIVNFMKPAHTHFVKLVEPTLPVVIDHLELGLSELGVTWELH